MLMGVRMYATEQQARDAIAMLIAEELPKESIHLITPVQGGEKEAVRRAVDTGKLPSSHARAAEAALGQGRSVLSVALPYAGQAVLDIMDSFSPVDTPVKSVSTYTDPAPLSGLLGLPTLTRRSDATARLLPSDSYFMSFFPLLSNNQRGKNSSLGFPTLTKGKSKNSSFGLPLLSKSGTPFSSMLGLKMLTGPKKRR